MYYDECKKIFWCTRNGKENKTKQKGDNLTPCKTIRGYSGWFDANLKSQGRRSVSSSG